MDKAGALEVCEEAFSQIIREIAKSYQNLPVNIYQINTKFCDKIRLVMG